MERILFFIYEPAKPNSKMVNNCLRSWMEKSFVELPFMKFSLELRPPPPRRLYQPRRKCKKKKKTPFTLRYLYLTLLRTGDRRILAQTVLRYGEQRQAFGSC